MYSSISDLGNPNTITDPVYYCALDGLDSQFAFGSTGFQKGNYLCSEYMSNRCAAEWDAVCQATLENPAYKYPRPECCPAGLTDGQAMLREAAFKHFLIGTKNCWSACEPFDPTVADSPLVCRQIDTAPTTGMSPFVIWALDGKQVAGCPALDNPPCEKYYGMTEAQMRHLDQDPIMQNLLLAPYIAMDLLAALAQWVKQTHNIDKICHTQFYTFARNQNLL